MTFRPFNSNTCRAAVLAACCVVLGVWGARAGQPIEEVPLHGSAGDTNFQQFRSQGDLRAAVPQAPHTLRSGQPGVSVVPPPQQQPQNNAAAEREKQLQDRRRNWVFMTPEEFASPDPEKDWNLKKNGKEDEGAPKTAMERYYQRLYDADHAVATNQLGSLKTDAWGVATNSALGTVPKSDGSIFGGSPFDSGDSATVFAPSRGNTFSGLFNSDANSDLPSPEAVRAQQAQKEHMDSFKELWDLNPPASTPTATASTPLPTSSRSVFDSPSAGQPAFTPAFSPANSYSPQAQATPQPIVEAQRAIKPPHSEFTPMQRPF